MKIKIFILSFLLASFLWGADTNDIQQVEESGWEVLRDPFWPVGYVPPERQETVVSDSSKISNDQVKWPHLEIKGITKRQDGSYVVFLKGHGLAEVGDIVKLKQTGLVYEFEITGISKAGLKYKKKKFSSVNKN